MADFEIHTTAHASVGDELRSYAEERIEGAARAAPRPVLFARLTLHEEANPQIVRPAVAKATLDVGGTPVRAHVAAATMREAVDLLTDRLRRRVEILAEHRLAARGETGLPEPGEWRHGSLPTERPAYFPRPPEERVVVRTKTFDRAAVTPKEAALDMELLDHDFHLFANADTGDDAVVHRRQGGVLGIVESPPEEPLARAIDRLELSGEPFAFFRDPGSGRGHVVYHRYDGHYGLITPAAAG
jgi:ribosome-associated translation inhibitor RaiA